MKTITFYPFAILLLLVSMNAYGKNTTQSENVLDKAVLMNSKQHPLPTTSYGKGHVSQRPVKHYVKTTKGPRKNKITF